ncbi:hypothetical protein [uncultured Duncaniella sp.]|uniref:hypothetical protein n=1 Tax=uncultured Duncaniella sp. TaxID=2768039 RepID=UPI002625883B|nr:hypothetical protein [uncultured Duncaniella sp.]
MKIQKLAIYLLLIVSACVGFTSCSNDDEPSNDVNSIIVGNWDSEFLGEMSYKDVEKLDLNDNTIEHHYMYFTFNSDGKGYDIYYNGERTEWTWEIIDDVIYTSDGDMYEIVKFNKDVVYLLRLKHYEAGMKLVRR